MTRSLDWLRRGLSLAALGAAAAFALPQVRAQEEPAPAAEQEKPAADDGASEEKPEGDAPEEKPELSKAEKLFQQAVSEIQKPHESQEALAAAIRKARDLFDQISKLPEGDADDTQRERAAALYDRMTMALMTYGTEEERKTIVAQMTEKILGQETIGPQDYGMMASLLEATAESDPDQAEATMAKFKTAIEEKGDEDGESAIAQLEGVMRRATLLGKKLELAGTTFDGAEFQISDLKGKVVLVDFWATWCPPCVAEHPNMVTNYRKYKDKGFEIVGVSLDNDREALAEFLEESEGHWIILHDEEGSNPATEYYAIQGIPTMFLLDEKGVVISTAARGEELTRLLEERFGKVELPAEEEEEKDAEKKEEAPKSEKAQEEPGDK